MKVFGPVVANLFLLGSALGLGGVFRRMIPASFSRPDRLAVILLGGSGLLGTILFCVGQFWFSRTAILVVLCAGVLLGLRSLRGEARQYRIAVATLKYPPMPVAIVAAVLLVTAVAGLALPVHDMNDDAIAYHYLGPSVWLRQRVIRAVPDEVLTYFPALVETQYAALFSFGGERAPGLFAVTGLGSLLLITAGLGLRFGLDPPQVWWCLAVVAAMPAVYRGAFGGFLDALLAAFVLCAARIAFDARALKHFALFGLFCGMAMGIKYTGIIVFALLILCALIVALERHSRAAGAAMRSVALSAVAALLMASPFYLRNWILYGCPIYPPPPLLLHFFTAQGITPVITSELVRSMTLNGMGRDFLHLVLLPFNLTYHTANFQGAGGIGLVPWSLAPFGIAAVRRDAFAKGLALFAALQLLAWFLSAQVSRYLIDVYAIGAVFGVVGWNYLAAMGSRFTRVLCAIVVGISISYGLFMIFSERADDVHAALSSAFEKKRRIRDTPWAESFDYLNSDPSVAKVLILDPNVAPYFLNKDYVKPFGRWGERTVPGVTNIPELLSRLPALRVTHILDIKFQGASFQLPGHPPGLTPVFQRENQIVYRVDGAPH